MSGSDPSAGSTAPTLAGLLCAKRQRALLTRAEAAERAADGADRIAGAAAAQLIADVPYPSHGHTRQPPVLRVAQRPARGLSWAA